MEMLLNYSDEKEKKHAGRAEFMHFNERDVFLGIYVDRITANKTDLFFLLQRLCHHRRGFTGLGIVGT